MLLGPSPTTGSAPKVPYSIRASQGTRALSLLLLIAFLPGCTNWHQLGPTPRAGISEVAPSRVRVTRMDRSTILLENAMVVGDSIVGRQAAPGRGGSSRPRVSVPLTDVAEVASPRFNAGKTLGLVLGTAALALVVACLAADCAYMFHDDPS